jgi:Glycosyltransferases, probably involved in cell wall biogenesis
MFSIIIPLYNKERYIKDALLSVLNQTYQEFEIIVVDDGSTDNSIQRVLEIKDERIRLCKKANGGVSGARNYGIKCANYDFIALLDADDVWLSEYLMDMVSLIKEFPNAYLYSSNFEKRQNGKIRQATNNLNRGYIDNYFKSLKYGTIIWSSAVIIRKNVFDNVGFFNERISRGEDIDMWTRIAAKYQIAYSNNLNVKYLVHPENSSANFVSHPFSIFAFYIQLDDCVNYYHFAYLRKLLYKRTFRYLIYDRNVKYFIIMLNKQWKNLLKFSYRK